MGPETENIHFIPLSNGLLVRVDREDWNELSKFKWTATRTAGRKKFYAMRNIVRDGRIVRLKMHRVIAGATDCQQIDHANMDTCDNRRTNLRLCTTLQNSWNKGKRADNTSGYKGVIWLKSRSRWRAQIVDNGKFTSIGNFKNKLDAAQAYVLKAFLVSKEWTPGGVLSR